MSSFGSSAINKSTRTVAPKGGRRRLGVPRDAVNGSQPSKPAVAEIATLSNVNAVQDTSKISGFTPTASDDNLLSTANDTSQSARDNIEASLRQAAIEAERADKPSYPSRREPGDVDAERPQAELQVASRRPPGPQDSETDGDSRLSHKSPSLPVEGLEQRQISSRPSTSASRQASSTHETHWLETVLRAPSPNALISPNSTSDPLVTTENQPNADEGSQLRSSRRLRGASQRLDSDRSANDLETSRSTLANAAKQTHHTQSSSPQPLVSGAGQDISDPAPHKKARKVRKDKGLPRKRKSSQAQSGENSARERVSENDQHSSRELRRRPVPLVRSTEDGRDGDDVVDEDADNNAEVAERQEAVRKRSRRKSTPEHFETQQIDPATAQMGELCIPTKYGKVSKREKEMRKIDWEEVKRKRRRITEDPEQSRSANTATLAAGVAEQDEENDDRPRKRRRRTQLVNGVATVITDAMAIDQHAEADQEIETLEVVEHNDLTRRMNSYSFIDSNRRDPEERKFGRLRGKAWSEEATSQFYRALQMWGTDFEVIAPMLPGRNRAQVKNKFVREERDDPLRIDWALKNRIPMDLKMYSLATGITEFADGDRVRADIDAMKAEQEGKIAEERLKREKEERQRTIYEGNDTDNPTEGESTKENRGSKASSKGTAKEKRKTKGQKTVHVVKSSENATLGAGADDYEVVGVFED